MDYSIPLIKPYITDTIKQKVLDVLDSGMLTEGAVTREFEAAIARYCGAEHALAVTSCTTGLELALRCLGIGPGDEVIVPDYTYPATAAVVNIVGATAVIVDIDPASMLIDCDALEAAVTPRTRAVIPVSLFGNPLDWDRLESIKKKHHLFMVEDAACAMGSSYKGNITGTLADITVFSHHPRKFITTGEGGSVTTDDNAWADWMNSYKHFGVESESGRLGARFVQAGSNYKLSNLLAAVGVEQMAHINELLTERRRLAGRYSDLLVGLPGVRLPRTTAGGEHSWQTFCVFVEDRDCIIETMRGRSIEVQIGTYSLHMHPAFANSPQCRIEGDMAGSRYAYAHALALPMYPAMGKADQVRVVKNLAESVR